MNAESCDALLFKGTTDVPCEVTDKPSPSESEVQFILNEIKHYLNPDVDGGFKPSNIFPVP